MHLGYVASQHTGHRDGLGLLLILSLQLLSLDFPPFANEHVTDYGAFAHALIIMRTRMRICSSRMYVHTYSSRA